MAEGPGDSARPEIDVVSIMDTASSLSSDADYRPSLDGISDAHGSEPDSEREPLDQSESEESDSLSGDNMSSSEEDSDPGRFWNDGQDDESDGPEGSEVSQLVLAGCLSLFD